MKKKTQILLDFMVKEKKINSKCLNFHVYLGMSDSESNLMWLKD